MILNAQFMDVQILQHVTMMNLQNLMMVVVNYLTTVEFVTEMVHLVL